MGERDRQREVVNMHSKKLVVLKPIFHLFFLRSGCRRGAIFHHDVRVAQHKVGALHGHTQEVCGLKWSPDGTILASGGNDNCLFLWPQVSSSQASTPLHRLTEHMAAVKVLCA